MNMQDKLKLLKRIAQAFHSAGITWAVGASLMLYLRGIAPDFNDIDLIVADPDAALAKSILDGMGSCNPQSPSESFRTRLFLEYEIDGVEVDLMAGLIIVHQGVEHAFPLRRGDCCDCAMIDGESIPMQGVDQWRECYRLMGREGKVRMIDQYRFNQTTKENQI